MRESNYTLPPSNRAVISINQMLYDRRALDTNSTLALLNNLCQLTYLTSTSPRIREVLTMDGGLERMLDILRDSCLPREPTMPDLWGLNGPCTARTINVDRAISLRHSLAFQCVVNIGVRGNEAIRTRVVQAGALDIVAQILESWLKKNGIAVFSSSLGSQAAVDALAAGIPLPGVDSRARRRTGGSRHAVNSGSSTQQASSATREASAQQGQVSQVQRPTTAQASSSHAHQRPQNATQPNNAEAQAGQNAPSQPQPIPQAPFASGAGGRGLGQLMVNLIANRLQNRQPPSDQPPPPARPQTGSSVDTDVDMADAETEGGETDTAGGDTDTGADMSMDVEADNANQAAPVPSQQTTTPRARMTVLPLQIPRRSPEPQSDGVSASTSNAASLSGDEPPAIPRARSDNSLATNAAVQAAAESGRPASGMASRPAQLVAESVSSQSSPMPIHTVEHVEGMRGRRGTVVGRPLLGPRGDRDRGDRGDQRPTDESETSDGVGEAETDLAQATALAAAANAAMEAAAAVPNQENGPQPAIVEGLAGMANDEPDPEILAAEQARFDMEAGAPPGQPGAAQTPRVTTTEMQTTTTADLAAQVPPVPQAQIIIANHAPRGFQDLASYVGVSLLLNPEGTNYSEDNILLALQLLAYLSKYPHVRATFHHPRRPMHRTFDLGDDSDVPLPQRPAYSETPNIFSLVERFTFRPSPSDPLMYRIPQEIQYWAGVIMRNACRKDEAQGGIRQCAYMSCGRWERFPREFAKCRRCRKAKYCSKECQSKAWSEGHRFWCSLRSEPEPTADGGGGGGGSGGGSGGGGGGGGGRRDPPRRDNHAADDDDDDVDMADGDAVQQTPRATTRHNTHAAAPPGVAVMSTLPTVAEAVPMGAMAPTEIVDRARTPTPRDVPRPPSRPETPRAAETTSRHSPAPSPEALSTTAPAPPAPRPLPAFLKVGQPGGPSTTAEMNAAMAGPSRARSNTPPQPSPDWHRYQYH